MTLVRNQHGWLYEKAYDGDFDQWEAEIVATLPPKCPKCGGAFDIENAWGEEFYDAEQGYSLSIYCENNDPETEVDCDMVLEFEVVTRRFISFGADGEV